MEDEQRGRDDIREQMTSSERRAMVLAGELEELRTQLETAERARKAAEAELHETSDRVSELAAASNSLVTSKRKLEIDIQAMQVYSEHRLMRLINSLFGVLQAVEVVKHLLQWNCLSFRLSLWHVKLSERKLA